MLTTLKDNDNIRVGGFDVDSDDEDSREAYLAKEAMWLREAEDQLSPAPDTFWHLANLRERRRKIDYGASSESETEEGNNLVDEIDALEI